MRRIPTLTKGLDAENVMLAELHDVPIFSDLRARLNNLGLRTADDMTKESWSVVVELPALTDDRAPTEGPVNQHRGGGK